VVLSLCAILPAYVFWGAPYLKSAASPPAGARSAAPSDSPSPSATPTPSLSPSPPPAPMFPAAGKVFLGVSIPDVPRDVDVIDRFAAGTRYQPRTVMFTRSWAGDRFDPQSFNKIAERGALPVLGWEPLDHRVQAKRDVHEGSVQPAYRLIRIINGDFDGYLNSYAQGIKSLGYRVGIRFAHEMNGFWYPWGEQTNGNRPGEYIQAYRHVHDLFAAAGVTNVIWLWSPNISYEGGVPLAPLYPGDAYVDWLGLSGYYGINGPAYIPFDGVFNPTLAELRRISRKPIVLTEIGASDAIGKKADWVTDMFRSLPRHPEIIGVLWFEFVKEQDWRIGDSPAASRAYAAGAVDPRYDARWTLASVPQVDTPPPVAAPGSTPGPSRTGGPRRG
jgi:hypothetical protein